jgi:hypothetical protein
MIAAPSNPTAASHAVQPRIRRGEICRIRVPMREINLTPKTFNGTVEVNDPVRVYDTSGQATAFNGDVEGDCLPSAGHGFSSEATSRNTRAAT